MSFLEGLTSIFQGIGVAAEVVGVATSLIGANDAADALENQAAQLTGLSEVESRAIREIAETEARIYEAEASDAMATYDFNIGIAMQNAAWERRAGEISIQQATLKWENQVKSTVARFAASGARLDGTTNAVIAEQVGEMEKDLFVLGLNTERAAGQQEEQARMFSLQKDQLQRRAATRAAARRRVGEIDAETSLLTGGARASAAGTQAGTARIAGYGSALRGTGGLLGDIADMLDGPTLSDHIPQPRWSNLNPQTGMFGRA